MTNKEYFVSKSKRNILLFPPPSRPRLPARKKARISRLSQVGAGAVSRGDGSKPAGRVPHPGNRRQASLGSRGWALEYVPQESQPRHLHQQAVPPTAS